MWDFLKSKPIEQQQIKIIAYTAWIKINHLFKKFSFDIERYLVWTFDICYIYQFFYTTGSMWKNTLEQHLVLN